MFPILPILILLLLGPTKVERLAVEGRLPAGLLAVHRAMVPVRAVVAAQVEAPLSGTAVVPTAKQPRVAPNVTVEPPPFAPEVAAPGWPTRAGPMDV